MEAPEVRYAKSGDVNVAYSVIGDGPFDLIMVSGWVLSNLEVSWEGSAAEMYERLASFCRLILFDKRGTGLSDRDTGIPDLETRMDDIRAVMDAVGTKRAAILGVSEGGPMTLLFAATYPERVAAAIAYGTMASYKWAPDYPWGLKPEEWEKLVREMAEGVGTPEWLDERLETFAPSQVGDEDNRRWWRKWVLTSASPGAVLALRKMNAQIDVRHALPAIRVPTLVLHRTDDDVPEIEQGRYIAEHVPGAEFVELEGRDHGWWVNSGQIVDEIERFLTDLFKRGEWDAVPESDRILATVLFTDIVDSTAKLAELGDAGWRDLLQRHHTLIRRQLARFSGREIDTAGDGFFASFDGPARAIRCAMAIRDAMPELGIQIRAGLHTGECEQLDGKVGGIAVHIGSRVASQAGAGEVLVSSTVHDLVAGSGIQFEERGVTELKGVPGAWAIYSVAGV